MQVRVVTEQPWEVEADVLAVPIATGETDDAALAELDRRLERTLGELRRIGELPGKAHQGALVRGRNMAARWLLGMGVGDLADFGPTEAYRFGAAVERRLFGRTASRLAVWLPEALAASEALELSRLVELVVRGVVEGSHEPASIYREELEAAPPQLERLVIVVPGADASALARSAEKGRAIGEGANRARRLAQRASNDVSPEVLADEATAIAQEYGLRVEVHGPDWALEQGMGLFMSVGRGSDNPPRFIVLRAGERGRTARGNRLLAMVGKGVTFDSGGISIKPADRMEEMKMDKTGACTVISAIATVAELAPRMPIMAVAPAVENMPGPHSTRPGDVVRALNGKVVEVQNTDAEGRLILGDALTYAEREGATHLVDVATLTGAVERAFGKLVTGAFADPDEWWGELEAAGRSQGERYWRIPLVDEYKADMESWYADFTNTGGAEGSLVKSGLFLKEFVTRPWAHLDIGGTAYLRKPTPWASRGATGVTHATLVELALAGAE